MRNTFQCGCTFATAILFHTANARAQVNNGHIGSDGAFNPMADFVTNTAVI
ncbi:MAG: hypothetical protein HY298_15470 [Verrucomicrobia bacterium]|nr:hypothetical protein [Verrucomicrobiota bacterium]